MVGRLEKHEWVLRAGLVAVYAFVRATAFPTWELTGDDGITLSLAQKATERFFWSSTASSVGVPHLPFCYYLLGVFWAIGGSLLFMQWAITLTQLAAHWWLIGIVKRMYSTPTAYAASLLAFFSPADFSFAGQKFWQPSLLPLLSALLLLALLKYLRERRVGILVLGAWIVVLMVSSLQSSILFLPVLAAVGALFPPRNKPGALVWLGLLLLVGLLSPLLLWMGAEHPFAAAAAIGLIAWIRYRRPRLSALSPRWRSIGGGALVLLGGVKMLSFTSGWNPLAGLASLLCAYAPYLRAHWGMEAAASRWAYLPEGIPLVLFFAVSAAGWRKLGEEKKMLLLFLSLPVAGFVLAPARGTFYPHWTLLLFPWLWVGVAAGIGEMAGAFRIRPVRIAVAVGLFAGLLGIQIGRTLPAQRFVRESGGIGKHGPNLERRLELFKRIAVEADPHMTFLVYPFEWPTVYFYEGWNFLAHNIRRFGGSPAPPGQRKYYYIYQDTGSKWGPTLLEVARSAPGVAEEHVGPTVLFSAPRPIANAGLELR